MGLQGKNNIPNYQKNDQHAYSGNYLTHIFAFLVKKNVSSHSHRGVEQLVARRAHNPKVIGSSPVPATKKSRSYDWDFQFK